ncbi:sensor domain-containing diguanylate cyclase [Thalassospira alkalitolerans]|uniref:diguanylate cyclase n=1 Tax=Thalassospira alkalitolerans TaxID=1293890 RepID=A0A1Y2LHU3_9PROT|nr:sensor domain-containing diguanylate cyclase [Thalassospira alkalitolerans]OSQ50418.1 diguanylate cyclase [Thalassospira alkalitolerans]
MPGKKIYFAVVLCVLLVVGFLTTSFVSFYVARQSLEHQIAESTLPLTSDNIYSEIQRDLLQPIFISSLMAQDTFVRDWTLSGEEDPQQIIRYLGEIQMRYDTVTSYFISEKTRNYYHPTGVIKQVSEDDPADSWYFQARNNQKPYEINVDSDTADRSRLAVFVNYQVRDYDGNVIGITGVGLSVNSVTRLIETYQKRYGRTIYFVDKEGRITLHGSGFGTSGTLHDREGIRIHATQILTSPGASITYEDHGETYFVNSRLVPEFGWLLLVEQREHIGDQQIETTFLINIAVSLLITAIVSIAAYLTIRNYQGRLEELASRDKLTGACNRQVFDLVFDNVAKSCKRRDETLGVVCIDLDEFKDVNDTFGHPGGDATLREVASIIRRHSRDSDTLCRWGGDEFILLLPGLDRKDTIAKAREIADAIRENPVRFGRDNIMTTASAGITEYRNGEEFETVITRVDNALYTAKSAGRDHISFA